MHRALTNNPGLRSAPDVDGNEIHPTVVVDGDVRIGRRNRILPYSILIGPLTLGDDNVIGPHVTIGGPGQDTRNRYYDSSQSRIEIGHGNIILEYSSVSKPVHRDATRIGNRCFIMQSVQIPHDVELQDDVTVTGMNCLTGLVRVLRGANIGIGCSIHQHSVIGHYSMVSMHSAVQKNVTPFSRYIARSPLSVNAYAIQKFGFQQYAEEISNYVLRQIPPQSEEIVRIVEEFDQLHAESGRKAYG